MSVIQEESDPAELYYSLLFECPTTCNGKGFSICHERPFEILLLKYLVVQLLQLVVIHRFYLNERLLLCMHCCMHGLTYKKSVQKSRVEFYFSNNYYDSDNHWSYTGIIKHNCSEWLVKIHSVFFCTLIRWFE